MLRLFTFGLETTDNELFDVCYNTRGGGASGRIQEEALREAMQRAGAGDVQVLVDTRAFSDPAAIGHLTRHLGTHPETMRKMSEMRNFPRWLQHLAEDIRGQLKRQRLAEGTVREVRVAFYCRSGRHRSVAGCRFLEHIARAEGWECRVRHLSQMQWSKTCKGRCEECEGVDPDRLREETLNKALGLWMRQGRSSLRG